MKNKPHYLNEANILIFGEGLNDINILNKILKSEGYSNIHTISKKEFSLKLLSEDLPDVILMFVNWNEISAYEICKTIKTDEDFKEIPIVFVGEYDNIDKEKVFSLHNGDYITIPFIDEEVTKRINSNLKLRYMELYSNDFKNNQAFDEIMNTNKELLSINKKLKNDAFEKQQQLEEITTELKEFNIILEEEITERTKTEEALKESERQFRYSIEEAPIPIMLYTEEGKVKNINKAWASITGYTIDDMPMTSQWTQISDVFTRELYEQSNDYFNNSTFETKHDMGEFSVKTHNSDLRIWNFHSAFIGDLQDGHKLFVILAIDITERKHMEELENSVEEERKKLYEIKEYDRIRTEFFSNISHELRTPINVIFSALQMFEISIKEWQCTKKSIDGFKYINIMKQNCYRILRLINNLIDITKIDSGYFDINEQNTDVISLIENITLSVADYVENKGLSLIFDTNVEEKIIACDPEKMERIILNLLSNSVKFTSSGGSIMVTIEDCSESIRIKIKDTGRGIPEDKIGTIFDRFVQVDKSLTRDHEGSGIGLSLVKSLVELHSGTIMVKSNINRGTEFILCFPCKLVEKNLIEPLLSNSINKNYIEKINIEFSDIYN